MGAVNARQEHLDAAAADNATTTQKTQVSLDGIGAKVVKVHVDGVQRTSENLLLESVKDIFSVRHFEDLVLKAQDVRSRLQALGCFGAVSIHIDTSEDGGPRDYEVTFKVQELRRVVGSINTLVGNQEGSVMTGLKLPNLFGRGERFAVDYTYGSKKTNAFNASLAKPLHGRTGLLGSGSSGNGSGHEPATINSNVFQQIAEFAQSGFKELNRGVLLDLTFVSAPAVVHNLQWEGVWRELRCLNRATPFEIREHAGHSVKSAIKHMLSVDRRDNPIFPSEGSYFRLKQEFAGLGGDVGFFKNEVEIQANLPIFWSDLVLQGSFNAGLIKRTEEKAFTVSDNFFLGGPMDVRGFELRGLGPHADGSALGGLGYWSTGLHLYAPLPFRPGRGGFGDLFRSHLFLTAGNLTSSDLSASEAWQRALADLRVSYGLGIALKLGGIARVELNYCIPAICRAGDRLAPGLQFGVGVNFL